MVTFATSTPTGASMSPETPVDSPPASELRDLQFRLTHTLQRTLEVETTLESFFNSIQDTVKVAGIHFEAGNLRVELGERQKHSAQYQIGSTDAALGTLTLSRSKRFMEVELAVLEMLIGMLFFPLRNALLYREAMENSMRDALTGIGNRLAMDTAFDREMKLAQRYGYALSLVIVDIDHFKCVNDTYGHQYGDKVLCHVAQMIKGALRETDQVFRFGGEEFAILLNNTNGSSASGIAERIRSTIAATPARLDGRKTRTTLSVGLSTMQENDTPSSLFERADNALYRAKELGRNRIQTEPGAPPDRKNS